MEKPYLHLSQERYFGRDAAFEASRHPVPESYALHGHDFFELEYVLSGRGEHILDGRAEPAQAGFLCLLSPADFHEYRATEPLDILNFKFTHGVLSEETRRALYDRGGAVTARLPELAGELTALLAEYEGTLPGRDILVRQGLERACILALRAAPPGTGGEPDRSAIGDVLFYIHCRFRQPLTMRETAAAFHLTPNYFSELFKKRTGRTFTDYLCRLRLDYAARLLKVPGVTVTQAAQASGFSSAAYFSALYKRRYGHPPAQGKR